jgi:hypothetical protein
LLLKRKLSVFSEPWLSIEFMSRARMKRNCMEVFSVTDGYGCEPFDLNMLTWTFARAHTHTL